MTELKKVEENMVFQLNQNQTPEEANLMHLEWAVVSQLDGQKTVRQIADSLSLNTKEIEEIFKKLAAADLLVVVNKSDESHYLPQEFFKTLNHEMTLLLGPVATIILEDVLEMMHQHREGFERNLLPVFIELLINQIDDQVKQVEFQKRIYPIVKSYIF
jgi:predicted ArsR family transcriptional regulator